MLLTAPQFPKTGVPSESEARLALSRTRRLASLASLPVADSVARRSLRQAAGSCEEAEAEERLSGQRAAKRQRQRERRASRTAEQRAERLLRQRAQYQLRVTEHVSIDYVTHAHIPQR